MFGFSIFKAKSIWYRPLSFLTVLSRILVDYFSKGNIKILLFHSTWFFVNFSSLFNTLLVHWRKFLADVELMLLFNCVFFRFLHFYLEKKNSYKNIQIRFCIMKSLRLVCWLQYT